MIRLVACDLDETLLDDEKNVLQGNREAIAAFEAQGGIFVPCTGRIYTGLDHVLKQLGADGKPGHYVISTNGALITENTGRICASQGVDPQKALALTQYARKMGIGIELFTGEGIVYYENIDALEEKHLPLFNREVRHMPASLDFIADCLIPKVLYERRDFASLRPFVQAMPATLKEGLEISYSSDRYIELNHQGVHKGSGLRQLAKMLSIPMIETMAIGDSYNDLEMLKSAGYSVAMANAPKDIQAVCSYVCRRTYLECGVAEALEMAMRLSTNA